MRLYHQILAFSIAAVCATAATASTFYSGGLWYRLTGRSTVAVAPVPADAERNYEGVYIIPEQVFYDGYNYEVASIDDNAFCLSSATEVQIPNTVRHIGENAFALDEALTSVTLPLHLQAITAGMLAGTAVVNVAVPDGVEAIGEEAFQGCHQLHTVLLPATLQEINTSCLADCYNLYEIYCATRKVPRATGRTPYFDGIGGVDVVLPDQSAADLYSTDATWGDESAFTLFPDEDLDWSWPFEPEEFNASYQRVELGRNLAYRIFANDELIALTAADHYYLPILDHDVSYTIVPTTMMGDAEPQDFVLKSPNSTSLHPIEDDLGMTTPRIYAKDGVVYITGDNHGTWTQVYDCYGRLYYQRPSNDGEINGLPRNRVYIVICGKTVKKVFL